MKLYADEQYPYPIVKCLRNLGHDALTIQVAGTANQRIPDDRVSCQTFKTLFLSSRTLAVRDSVKKFRCKTAY